LSDYIYVYVHVCRYAGKQQVPDVYNLFCLVACIVKTSCDMDQDSSIAWGWHGATAFKATCLWLGLTVNVCNGVGPAA
jgi:hypothetical protein